MLREEITLNVPQGVGDVYWVYQLFYPYFKRINFNIYMIGDDEVQRRAGAFVQSWPKVGWASFLQTNAYHYNWLIATKLKVADVKDLGQADFSCNRWLEEGVNLEDIDPAHPPAHDIPLPVHYCPLPYKDYVVLYVSGSTRHVANVWNTAQWFYFIQRIYNRFGWSYPLILIGASYDKSVLNELHGMLVNTGHQATVFIGAYPGNVCYILQNSQCFIGYQSGLNILAGAVGARQIMLYFDTLRLMRDTWCRPSDREDGTFQYNYFDRHPNEVAESLRPIPAAPRNHGLFTCNVEEAIAVDGFLRDEEADTLRNAYWASPDRSKVEPLYTAVYPSLKHHVVLQEPATPPPDMQAVFDGDLLTPAYQEQLTDYSTAVVEKQVREGDRRYVKSRFVTRRLADLPQGLPEKYYSIASCGMSPLTPEEWQAVVRRLEAEGVMGVVVETAGQPPASDRLLNLSDELTLPTALEIVKCGVGFIGCCSAFAVLAAKAFPASKLLVKRGPMTRGFLYLPHESPDFIRERLSHG